MKILPVNNYQNRKSNSNQPNFQARDLYACIYHFDPPKCFKAEELGAVYRVLQTIGELQENTVGILRKGITAPSSNKDFLISKRPDDNSGAGVLEERLNAVLDKVLRTDGEPIHLDGDYVETAEVV